MIKTSALISANIMAQNLLCFWAVIVAEGLLPTTENPGSNPAISNLYKKLLYCLKYEEDKEKEVEIGSCKKKCCILQDRKKRWMTLGRFYKIEDLLLHGEEDNGLPVDAVGNLDGRNGGQAGSRRPHKQLKAHSLQSWRRIF